MKHQADKHRRPADFAVGDHVLLASSHLPLPPDLTRKLAPKFVGPFEVLEATSPVAYRLQLTGRFSHLHPVFHAS